MGEILAVDDGPGEMDTGAFIGIQCHVTARRRWKNARGFVFHYRVGEPKPFCEIELRPSVGQIIAIFSRFERKGRATEHHVFYPAFVRETKEVLPSNVNT